MPLQQALIKRAENAAVLSLILQALPQTKKDQLSLAQYRD
jgi:hypothetical protein